MEAGRARALLREHSRQSIIAAVNDTGRESFFGFS
jgi:hypothetical protein